MESGPILTISFDGHVKPTVLQSNPITSFICSSQHQGGQPRTTPLKKFSTFLLTFFINGPLKRYLFLQKRPRRKIF